MRISNGGPDVSHDSLVLFPFDDHSVPFQRLVKLHLNGKRRTANTTQVVVPLGEEGAHDSVWIAYYGTVVRVGDELWMWYLGQGEDRKRRSCYAVSKDGFNWERPKLGLVEYNGHTQNNLVEGPCGEWVLYDPEDPDPCRRFKSLRMEAQMRISVAYSEDGLRWRDGPHDIFGIGMELGHVCKFNGCYYANGQGGPSPINRPIPHPIVQASKRITVTFASYDFEHWTHAAALSFRKDNVPPRTPSDFEPHRGEQVHEGAALWDRGNVLIGLYGQYHGQSNDRRYCTVDLGFVVSQDALHFKEPVADFKMVHSYEERDGAAPRLVQRNAFANIGDRTVYWYSVWRESPESPTGVRVATWERDRFGYFSAARRIYGFGAAYGPHCISCPIELDREGRKVFVNADGLGEYSRIRVELLDLQFRPVPGYSGDDCAPVGESGLRQPVSWREKEALPRFDHPVRIRVNWEGVRPEDARLYSIYVGGKE